METAQLDRHKQWRLCLLPDRRDLVQQQACIILERKKQHFKYCTLSTCTCVVPDGVSDDGVCSTGWS